MLTVYTVNREFVFKEEDAKNVYDAIEHTGSIGSDWTIPIKLQCGKSIVFILSNIVAIENDIN